MSNSCVVCDVPFGNLLELKSHQETIHLTKIVTLHCAICDKSFERVESYINHLLASHLHLGHLRYCCLICDSIFYGLVPLHRHVNLCHPSDCHRIFQCLVCGLHSGSLMHLKKHRQAHDDDEETEDFIELYKTLEHQRNILSLPVQNCYKNADGTVSLDCDKKFKSWNEFTTDCSSCDKSDLSPVEYIQHHQNKHSKEQSVIKLKCKDCPNESFNSILAFHYHIVQTHDNQDLSFQCIVCTRMFWNYADYSYHLKFAHPSFKQFSCLICGKMLDRHSLLRHHLAVAHGTEISSENRRKLTTYSLESQDLKQTRLDILAVKQENDSESDAKTQESDSTEGESSDKARKAHKIKRIKLMKPEAPKRRPNNRHRPEKQSVFGPEINTPEKLYAKEIKRASVFPAQLHLNISIQGKLPNGEIPEELAVAQGVSSLRWRDLLFCAACQIKFSNIIALTDHIAKNHGTRTRAFGCFNCDIEYGALYESSLVNHLVERHYHEHLKLCCLVCSKLFYDFVSLVNHYKSHGGRFEILVCFICGFYAKTLDDLKEHKAYHVQMDASKPENQIVCERVLEKFSKGAEPNTTFGEVAEHERYSDGTVTVECQRRFKVDWSFAQYQCSLCSVTHPNPFELFAHLRLKHPKEQEQTRKIYSCDTCVEKKEFSGMHYFYNHAAEFHFKSLRFTCVVCSRLFWNYLALANHYKNIHPSFTAVFCCHCGKLFHSITSGAIHYKKIMILLTEEEKKLKREGKLETEESIHICHVCGKRCKNNYTLVKHISTHEEPDPSKMLQCHVCSKL